MKNDLTHDSGLVFNGKSIRAEYVTESNEWLFSVVDVVAALAEPKNPRKYWNDTKRRLNGNQLSAKIGQLKMPSADGKLYHTDVLNEKGLMQLSKHIRSPYTEAFTGWLRAFGGKGRRFVLKHKDIAVVELELDESGAIAVLGKTLDVAHLPVGTADSQGVDFPVIKEWWKGRSIPASREGLRPVLDALGIRSPQQLLDKGFGLSLSDQYWICPQGEELKWADINFFHNPFSEDVGNLLFRKLEVEDMDAISLLSPDNTSDGVLKKKWKIIDGKRCLIKGGSKPLNQEVANEVLASRICGRLGIPHVNYEIVELDGDKYSVCEDFITGDTELVTAWHIKKMITKGDAASAYERYIAKTEELGISDARQKTDMMLTLDFIIVNTDRHYNNFGLIRDANTLEWLSVAPIYDSGTSMWSKELPSAMDAESMGIESKPFRGRHDKQIKLVRDFSWLNLDALDGIEDEYAEILSAAVSDPSTLAVRNNTLCRALRKRIEWLKRIVNAQDADRKSKQ